jgi:hypothetical protein
VDTPLSANHELWKTIDNCPNEVTLLKSKDSDLYRSLVGALLYAANISRIDIAYAVGQLCRYTSKPCVHHLESAYRVIRYVRDTPELCLIFGLHSQNLFKSKIEAYCDSDWAGDKADGKSTTGCIIRFNGDVMNWLSKKQTSVAMSSAEAEYIAAGEATKELLWYRSWISEVLFEYVRGLIRCDNQAAITLTQNVLFMRDQNISDFDTILFVMKERKIILRSTGLRVLSNKLTFSLNHSKPDRLPDSEINYW